MNLKNIYIL